jgi:predicted Rossmann fold flavoprotein
MYDVIIIGAGPSGIMTAIQTSKKGLKTLLIDKNKEIGKKLKLTGGGRCNITNLKSKEEFISKVHNGAQLSNLLTKFDNKDLYKYIEALGVALKEEENNRIFTKSGSAQEIIDVLKEELKETTLMLDTIVEDITLDFKVITNKGIYQGRNIVLATGGKSYPQTGSNGSGYILSNKFGHQVTSLYPSETYLVTKIKHPLQGITINAKVTYDNNQEQGNVLFTHLGLSGPSILNISEKVARNIKNNDLIEIDLLPNISKEDLMIIIK